MRMTRLLRLVVVGAGFSLGLAVLTPGGAAATRESAAEIRATAGAGTEAGVMAVKAKVRRPGAPEPRNPSAPVCDGSIAPVLDGRYTKCIVRWKAAKPHGRRVTKYLLHVRTVGHWNKPTASVTSWTPVGVGPWVGRTVLSRKARSHVFADLGPGEHQIRVVAKNARGRGPGSFFVATAGPPLSVRIDPQASSIFLFDPSVANPDLLVPAVTVTGTLRNCDPSLSSYSQVVTLAQDGHTYTEWGGHSGYGEVLCMPDRTSTLHSDPLLDFDGTLHSGRAVVTLTLTSPDDASVELIVKADVTIP